MEKRFSILVLLGCLLFIGVDSYAQNARHSYTLNSNWAFYKGPLETPIQTASVAWDTVSIPHSWNTHDVMDDTRGYYRGEAWYLKRFRVGEHTRGKNAYLEFKAVNQEAEVYVNGALAGSHVGGYTAFIIDITPYILYGEENEVLVKANNRFHEDIPTLTADFTFFGGIYRDVFLTFTDKVHFSMSSHGSSGVLVSTPKVSATEANVEIKGQLLNETNSTRRIKVVSYIKDAQSQTVATTSSSHNVRPGTPVSFTNAVKNFKSPNLWSPDSPYLYRVVTQIVDRASNKVLDEVSASLGFRWFRFDAEKGFFLNGEHLKLIGTNRHQDYPYMANALPKGLHLRDVELVKAMGSNFLRVSHYPQDPAIMEACDRLGLITAVEIPIVNRITESDAFADNSEEMLREMIMQNYNHPSVVIWAYMNEVLLRPKFQDEPERQQEYFAHIAQLAQRLENVAREMDPYRYTMIPNHGAFNLYKRVGLTDIPMIVGWNLYQGWYGSDIKVFAQFLDRHRKEIPDKPLIVTEYGAGADPRLRSDNPARFDFSLEYLTYYHQTYLEEMLARDFVAGANVWNLADFSSESRVDAVPHINNKGLLTHDRKPKEGYFLYQAYLLDRPFVSIGPKLWDRRIGIETDRGISVQRIEAFTNMPKATLYLNGQSLGEKEVEMKIAAWDVPFQSGENLLEIVAESEGKVYKDFHKVDFQLIPTDLKSDYLPFSDLKVSLGDSRTFLDDLTGELWLPDQKYVKGSWGTLGGEPYRMANLRRQSFGSDQNILGTPNDPIYQSQQVGLEGFRADLPNGLYEITLHFAELVAIDEKETLAYNLDESENVVAEETERIFDVWVNDKLVLEDLNLAEDTGRERAVAYRVTTEVSNDEGLLVSLKSKRGDPVLNAIEIKKIH